MEVEHHVQRYTKYIHEDLSSVDIDTATYKDHLHKIFEWLWCIILTKEHHSIFLRWEDIPPDEREKKGMMRDMGIDAWDMKGNRVIQMKCYNGLISWRCISTFLACCSLQFKDALKILCRTLESSLHPLIQGGITNGDILDKTISDHVFRTECKRIQSLSFPTVTSTEKLTIRPYQEQAIYFMEKGQEKTKNVYLSIPTGCGKTFIILQYHQRHIAEKMLVLVPTIVLLEQWGGECEKMGIHSFLIGTGHHHSLDELTDETIVICVYNSIVNIHTELHLFERYIVDEAHHVETPERYMDNEVEFKDSEDEFEDDDEEEFDHEEEVEEENEDDIEDEKVEQKSYSSYIRALADTKKVVYISATLDKPEDDSLFYEYSVRQAITDGYLVDYQFVFPIFEQDDVTNAQLAYYLVYKQHESHCIVYATSCEEGRRFQEQLNRLRPGCAGYIDADTSSSERKRLFKAFEDGLILFLVNVRVLVEGFNATHCRSIFFLHVSSNEVFVIQAIGRSLRLRPDKTLATIYVPYTSENDLDRIQSFLAHLSTYDERIKASMDTKSIGGYIRLEKMEKMEEMEDDDEDEKKEETLCGHRYNLVADSMGKINGICKKDKIMSLLNFTEKESRIPKNNEIYNDINIGWLWSAIKHNGVHKKLYDDVLSKNEMLRNDYEKSIKIKEDNKNKQKLDVVQKGELLLKFVSINNRSPFKEELYLNIHLGRFWSKTKMGQKKHLYDDILSKNEILRKDYEKTCAIRTDKKQKPILTPKQKCELLLDFVEKEGRIPIATFIYKDVHLGHFWTSIKSGHIKKLYDDILSKNELLKKDYEKTCALRIDKKQKTILTAKQKCELLLDFVEKEKRVPTQSEIYNDVLLGSFFNGIKQGLHKKLFNDMLSNNKIIKSSYDKRQAIITPEQKCNFLLIFVEKEKRAPTNTDEYGKFWKSITDGCHEKLYIDILSKNCVLKKDYETVKNKEKLTPLKKCNMLVSFVEKEKRAPVSSEIYENVNLGNFWRSTKKGYNKKLYDDVLSKYDILRIDYEK